MTPSQASYGSRHPCTSLRKPHFQRKLPLSSPLTPPKTLLKPHFPQFSKSERRRVYKPSALSECIFYRFDPFLTILDPSTARFRHIWDVSSCAFSDFGGFLTSLHQKFPLASQKKRNAALLMRHSEEQT